MILQLEPSERIDQTALEFPRELEILDSAGIFQGILEPACLHPPTTVSTRSFLNASFTQKLPVI